MNNFEFFNPTKIIFGEGVLPKLEKEVNNRKVLLCYGGGSIKQNGVYHRIKEYIGSNEIVEFGGIKPNPEIEYLEEGIDLAKKENINFILAVGGGSVIDAAKFMSACIKTDAKAIDVLKSKIRVNEVVDLGVVLTTPATGSEMNPAAVISIKNEKSKLVFVNQKCYPVFSIVDIDIFSSIPNEQIANGIVDAFVHVTEQYITYPANAKIQDGLAEVILKTLISDGIKYFENRKDKDALKNFAWATTMALNGMIATGVPQDWLIHTIGHEITAIYGLAHAHSLALILPLYYRLYKNEKREKLLSFAKNVWGINANNENDIIEKSIENTEHFFNKLGVKTKFTDYNINKEELAEEIFKRFNERNWTNLGEKQNISPGDVRNIILF